MNTQINEDIFERKAREPNISRQTQRVYLCFDQANKDDVSTLIDDVLSRDAGIDCVVTWINKIDDLKIDDLQDEFKETQAIIVLVTKEFIESFRKTGIPPDYKTALEKNIPILPIAKDETLLPVFSEIVSKLHGIAMNDPEYRIKLKAQLENFLVSESLKEQIDTKAFTAEIFLSYRKVDLDDARELMKDLHNIEGLQGISIWYDHFLTAGREFDSEILEAIEKSSAFILLVTPNITKNNEAGELNYVAREEVPFAIEKEKAIIPVEVRKRDSATFAAIFPAIDEPVSKEALNKAFREKLSESAYIKTLGSERSYLLGMAYLRGHKVERDMERAVKLLETAASSENINSLNASEQLANIYEEGLGGTFPINYTNALHFHHRSAVLSEKINGKKSQLTASIYNKIGVVYDITGEYVKSMEYFNKAILIYKKLFGNDHIETAITYNNIGRVYIKLGKTLGITVLYYALKTYQDNFGENHPYTARAYLDIGINHIENESFIMLHSIERAFYELTGETSNNKGAEYALNNISKALVIYKNIYGENNFYTAIAHNYLGKVFILSYKFKEAEENLNTAFNIINDIYGENHLHAANIYVNFGLLKMQLNDYDNALFYFNKVLKIKNNYFEENNIAISSMYNTLGDLYLKFDMHKEALEYYFKDVEILVNNYENNKENRKYEKKSYFNLKTGSYSMKLALKSKILLYMSLLILLPVLIIKNIKSLISLISGIIKYKKDIKNSSKNENEFSRTGDGVYSVLNFLDKDTTSNTINKIFEKSNKIADIYLKLNDYSRALDYFIMAMEIKRRSGFLEMYDADNILIYLNIIKMYFFLEKYEEALEYCKKAEKIHKISLLMIKKRKKNQKKKNKNDDDENEDDNNDEYSDFLNRNTADLFDIMGQIFQTREDFPKALEYFQKSLEIHNYMQVGESASTDNDKNYRDYHAIALIYNKIGNIHKKLNEMDKALMNYNKAYESLLYHDKEDDVLLNEIIEEIFLQLNNDTNGNLSHLNTILLYYGANIAALKINAQNKTIDINITINTDNDEDLAKLYRFTGNTYLKFNEKEKSTENLEKALLCYNNAVNAYKEKEYPDNEDLLKLLKDKLSVEEKLLGNDSLEAAKTCYSIGIVYRDLKNNEKRLEYYLRGLEIRIKLNGEEHADTATQFNNVGVTYNNLGNHDKAMEFHTKAIAVREKLLGEDHIDTGLSYSNIAYVYRDMKESETALELFSKSLKIYRTAAPKNLKKHMELLKEIIALQKILVGEENEHIALSYYDLGGVYFRLNNIKDSLANATIALNLRIKILGEEHPATALSYNSLGSINNKLKNYQKALEFHEKELEIYKKILPEDDVKIKNVQDVIEKIRAQAQQ